MLHKLFTNNSFECRVHGQIGDQYFPLGIVVVLGRFSQILEAQEVTTAILTLRAEHDRA